MTPTAASSPALRTLHAILLPATGAMPPRPGATSSCLRWRVHILAARHVVAWHERHEIAVRAKVGAGATITSRRLDHARPVITAEQYGMAELAAVRRRDQGRRRAAFDDPPYRRRGDAGCVDEQDSGRVRGPG